MPSKGKVRKIGPYTITQTLGRGGMGTVYCVVIPATGKTAALKQLNPAELLVDLLGPDTVREIFYAEAKIMARLQHPNIVKAWDIEPEGDQPYFTMEYFCNNIGMMIGEQFTLEQTTRIIRPDKAVAYANQVLDGLQYIHASGIIHRDIKPYNLLVTDHDIVKICDFGMSKHQLIQSFGSDGLNIGSPYYTAPEQNRTPDLADQRSDLYSVGVFLYRMLTGELPGMKSFPLSRINPLYDHAWDDFFTKSLSWNPDMRHQDAGEMTAALLKLELHWEKQKKKLCHIKGDESATRTTVSGLRSSPFRVSGSNAKKLFMVNDLWQPNSYSANRFTDGEEGTILDKATGLHWQQTGSDYPVDREEADIIIEALNAIRHGGLSTWRIPTVNELLTLVKDPALPHEDCTTLPFSDNLDWSWSCDRRSEKTSWYVNTGLGYVGWQDDGCRYSIRAVSSSENSSI